MLREVEVMLRRSRARSSGSTRDARALVHKWSHAALCVAGWGGPSLGSGHWMSSLLEDLVRSPGMQVEIATVYPGVSDDQFEENGVKYFVIGQPKVPGIFFRCRKRISRPVWTL